MGTEPFSQRWITPLAANRNPLRLAASGVIHLWLKGSVPIAQKNANQVTARICYRDVQVSIPIEIPCSNTLRRSIGRISHLRLESAVAIAKQYADVVSDGVCHRDIQFPVAIEVAHGHCLRIRTGGILRRLEELTSMGC